MNIKKVEIPDFIIYLYEDYIKPIASIRFLCRALGVLIVGVLIASAIYSLRQDVTFLPDLTHNNSWSVLFEREYFKNLFFSPLWILSSLLFAYASRADYKEWKERRSNLLMFLKDKDEVHSKDVEDIILDGFDAKKERRKREREARKIAKKAKGVTSEEQKV